MQNVISLSTKWMKTSNHKILLCAPCGSNGLNKKNRIDKFISI